MKKLLIAVAGLFVTAAFAVPTVARPVNVLVTSNPEAFVKTVVQFDATVA